MTERSNFWAGVCSVVATPAALAGGLVKGTIDVMSGNGGFTEGFDACADTVMNAADKFGAEHGQALTNAAIRVAGGAIEHKVNQRKQIN